MKGLPLGPCGEDITWPYQMAPRSRNTSSTRNLKPQTSNLYSSTYGVLGVRGGSFLFRAPFPLGFTLGCRFGLCGGLALLRTLAAPGIGPSSLRRRALGFLYRRVARCKHGVFTGGWDVRLGREGAVLQLEQLLGHDAKCPLGRLHGVGWVSGPGEEPVPGAYPVAAPVGRVAGGVACPRGGAFRGEGAS